MAGVGQLLPPPVDIQVGIERGSVMGFGKRIEQVGVLVDDALVLVLSITGWLTILIAGLLTMGNLAGSLDLTHAAWRFAGAAWVWGWILVGAYLLAAFLIEMFTDGKMTLFGESDDFDDMTMGEVDHALDEAGITGGEAKAMTMGDIADLLDEIADEKSEGGVPATA